ncbi:timeless protein-domain-containing protein [Zychaea mexicana]|uniref:timeless protein-domain-containing protein n=1 Tax=Zychaea mexicana TaxID=64656 RepID=UPI0022FE24B1|nr:timeless protein-domain-containing protein [Zychaea mexicana]KAI9490959.1 timeless protein-domain-containing protein [Zychaea mexicana]
MDDEVNDIKQTNRNYILATCAALGGFEDKEVSPGEFQKVYMLGDEALGCLKDLKRAIRAESQTPYKTFLPAIAEFNLIETDLIPIILLHARDSSDLAERFILACVELLVPMTWPIQYDDEEDLENYDPNLVDRYRRYKLALLAPRVFEAITGLVTGPLSIPYRERSIHDQTVIRLVLYFFRNITSIPDLNASQDSTEETLRLAYMQQKTVLRFHETGIMDLLLAIASNSGEPDAAEWNVIVLEIMYNLLRNVSPKDVFTGSFDEENDNTNMLSDKLANLLREENRVKRIKTQNQPTRHNRFGGSFAIKGWDGNTLVSHKPDAAYADLSSLLNVNKKEDRRGQKRKEMDEINVRKTYISSIALKNLKDMAQTFIDAVFNEFYLSLIKDIEREDPKFLVKDHVHFFHTMRWFLEYFSFEKDAANRKAEEERQKQKEKDGVFNNGELLLPRRMTTDSGGPGGLVGSFADIAEGSQQQQQQQQQQQTEEEQNGVDYDQVASAMDLRAFMVCLRWMRTAMDQKLWLHVQVAADNFRQLLVTVNAMSKAPQEEFREVAEYIQSNIYHEHATLDLFIDLIRKYLESTVKLTHVMLKLLEQYSQKNQVMFVRKKKNTKAKISSDGQEGSGVEGRAAESNAAAYGSGDSDDEEDEREQELAYREHIFKFQSFEKKYFTSDVVRVYCVLLERFEMLSPETLHCITSLFHRIMVKREVEHVFFKINVLELFNRIVGTYPSLPKTSAMSELVHFIRYCTRRFFKKAEEYPLLFVEILFANPKTRKGSRIQS